MPSRNLKKLLDMESEDRYVFHGSGMQIEELEPRQAYTYRDGENVKDGEPAVFASQFVDYAIFMALINIHTCPAGARSSCGYTDGVMEFGASQATLDQLAPKTSGFVHVFGRNDFVLRGGSEWMCTKKIKPVTIVKIKLSDFRPLINRIHEPEPSNSD